MKPLFLLVVFAMWGSTLTPVSAAPIHDAVKAADLVKTQQLLSNGSDANLQDEQSYTPLHWAVELGLLEIAQLLLEHSADVESLNNGGNTPLHVAAAKGRSKAAALLLERGAEINKPNNAGLSPLHLAIKEGRIATIEILLEHEAYTGGDEEGGHDALSLAISSGKPDVINLLISKGVPVTMEHLSPAICAHDIKIVQLLFKPRHEEDEITASPEVLAKTAMCGDRPILDFLMRSAGNINYSGAANSLSQSVSNTQSPNLDLVKILFAADPNMKEHATIMLGGFAYRGCSADFLAYLLNKGADVDKIVNESITSGGMLPYKHPKIAELFLAHGAKIDTVTEWGNSALMLAVPDNQLDAVRFLAEHGANINIANALGNTALHLAAARNLTETSALLISKGAKVNVANADGNTPLHQAVRFTPQFDTARLLLKNGADTKARNAMGFTALHYAASRGSDIASDTKVAGQDEVMEWQRPYEQATESKPLMELIQDLVKNGADVRAKDAKGRYPIDLARSNDKHTDIAPYLEAQMRNTKR